MNENKCIHLLDYFNDHLNPKQKEEFELHLLKCEECQEQLLELYEFNHEVATHSTQSTPPNGMKQRILGSILEDKNAQKDAQKVENHVVTPFKTPVKKKNNWKPWAQVIAAGLIASIGINVYTMNQLNDSQSELANTELERDLLASQINDAEQPPSSGTAQIEQVITSTSLLSASEENEHVGQASIVLQEDGYKLIVQVEQMPEPVDSEVYQVWLFQGETPLPTGSFTTNEQGEGAIVYDLDSDTNIEDLFEAIAITLEPEPDNLLPEGPIVTLSELY
ncbi:anti-sigma factor [Alkalicoccobacillus gibsonii]|uniref:Regulator of SigK n=1 Tax=Alkalicoccobacillus gibsonii TaxID=79881 RepID=A0ABU9VDU5_9BACI